MASTPVEQRNPYKGAPPRCWIQFRFKAPSGSEHAIDLVVDSGNPFAVIISQHRLNQLRHISAAGANTNFGFLDGGWLELGMPEFKLTQSVHGFASDAVVAAAKASHPDFEGLTGLPLLRLLEYGGDSSYFWIRPSA